MALALTTGKRNIKDGSRYNRFFPPESSAYGSNAVLQSNATVEETVKHIARVIKKDRADTARIAKILKGATRKETLANIHRFMVQYLQYDTEAGEKLRSPRRTWWVGQKQNDRETGDTGVDCDDLTIFAGSILKNLNIPFFIRIVKIDSDDFQHVYLIVPEQGDKPGRKYFTLDGVLSDFNYEYPYTTQKTFDMNGIKIEYLGSLPGKNADPVLAFVLKMRREVADGSLTPTKINKTDLLSMLDYAIVHWGERGNEGFKRLALAEQKHYPGQTFFSKLYGYRSENLSGLAGDWTAEDEALLDHPPRAKKYHTKKGGSNVWDALSSFFNAAAGFDWGLIGGRKNVAPAASYPPVPGTLPVQQQKAGFDLMPVAVMGAAGLLIYLYLNKEKVSQMTFRKKPVRKRLK